MTEVRKHRRRKITPAGVPQVTATEDTSTLRHQDTSLRIWCEVVELALFHGEALRRPQRGVNRQNAVLLDHVPARQSLCWLLC